MENFLRPKFFGVTTLGEPGIQHQTWQKSRSLGDVPSWSTGPAVLYLLFMLDPLVLSWLMSFLYSIQYVETSYEATRFPSSRKPYIDRWIRGIVRGPPCETWSKARVVLVPGKRHPRVVRTGARPHGLDNLTKKEALQVSLGSDLLGVAIRLMFAAIVSGAIGVLEHPENDPDDPLAASIWRLIVMRWLQRFANCLVVRVLQGHYGGYSQANKADVHQCDKRGGTDPL